MILQAIQQLREKKDLSMEMSCSVMDEIFSGTASTRNAIDYLTLLRDKGETIDEILGAVFSLRSRYESPFRGLQAVEFTGTGGDGLHTFNISTCSAFVAAAAGIPVIKHGNRAATSKSGSADILQALGVNLNTSPENCRTILDQTNMCFLFNQNFPQPMSQVAKIRREIGTVTILNKLRWINTAGAAMELLGVYQEELVEPLARVLVFSGIRRAVILHGMDGMDEFSVCNDTLVCEVNGGKINTYRLSPQDLGLPRCSLAELSGGSPTENAEVLRQILRKQETGAKRQAVLANAATAIRLALPGLSWSQACQRAADTIDSGKAYTQLEHFVEATNAFKV